MKIVITTAEIQQMLAESFERDNPTLAVDDDGFDWFDDNTKNEVMAPIAHFTVNTRPATPLKA